MRIKNIIFFMCYIFATHNSFAQVDSDYICDFDQEFAAKFFVSQRYITLVDEFSSERGLVYAPNTPLGIGVGLSWKGMGISFRYGFDFLRGDVSRGETKSFDFQYHYYDRKMIYDFIWQNYKGFYIENNNNNYTLFPNLGLSKLGLFGQYVLKGNQFSYRAVFDQSERQLQSIGSFLLGGSIHYARVRFNKSFEIDKSVYQFGPNIGYAYTWVFKKDYFISGSLTTGITAGFGDSDNKVDINPILLYKFASGYNSETWSVNFSFIVNKVYVSHVEERINLNSGDFQVGFIKRFNSRSKILKRLSRIKVKN